MTGPVPAGEIRITAHVDTSPVPGELERGLEKATGSAEGDLRKDAGPKMGDAIGDGIESSISKRGRDIADTLQKSLSKEHVAFRNVDFDNNEIQHVWRRVVDGMVDEFEQAFASAGGGNGGGGGIFKNFTSGIQDAIGAGFNVSGKSPLIFALVPVFGALALAITAAVQAANGLFAVLTTIPAAIAAIGIQAAIIITAFHGVGDAIQGALAAKNAKELKEAIKGLAPAAQDFVVQLVPTLRDFMHTFAFDIQQAFFDGFGKNMLPFLLSVIKRQFLSGVVVIAGDLGYLFQQLVGSFTTAPVVNFVNALLPLIDKWVKELTPALVSFVQGLANFALVTLPFFSKIGTGINNLIVKAGKALDDLSHNTHFQRWLQDMLPTLKATADLIGAAFTFLLSVVNQLDQNGGVHVIEFLTHSLESLAAWFDSPLGGAAIAGFITVVKILTIMFIGLVVAITLVFDAITGLKYAFMAILNVAAGIVKAIGDFFTGNLSKDFEDARDELLKKISELPQKAVDAIGNLWDKAFEAGRHFILSLKAGIDSAWEVLKQDIRDGMAQIAGFLPGSPAKYGALSGKGYTYLRGQRMVQDFARGVNSQLPGFTDAGTNIASSINFGRGAINVNYNGVSPTPDEARMTGSAIGEGVAGQLAARNDAMAVRTL